MGERVERFLELRIEGIASQDRAVPHVDGSLELIAAEERGVVE